MRHSKCVWVRNVCLQSMSSLDLGASAATKRAPPAPAGIPSTPLEIGHPLLKIKKQLLVHRNRLSDLLKDTYTSEASAWVGQPLCGWPAKTLFQPNSIRGATKRKTQTQSLPGGWIAPESLATWRQLFTKLFSLASACCTARAPQTWRLSWGQGSWNFLLASLYDFSYLPCSSYDFCAF